MSSIGRYRVVARLGAGAFSTVWLGHDDDLDVAVAIKVLAENWVGHRDVVDRFLEEARLLRRVEDRRVVRVHDIGRQADMRPYFVMDHVDGGTLADLTDLPLPYDEALDPGAQLAEAVQVLHDHGVLHRDVKPSNVLLTRPPARRVVVADLGMAKRLAESSGVTLTVGTPAFMAPEQAHQQSGLDVRADVYGVAAVTYLLLTGRRPFPGSRTARSRCGTPASSPNGSSPDEPGRPAWTTCFGLRSPTTRSGARPRPGSWRTVSARCRRTRRTQRPARPRPRSHPGRIGRRSPGCR